MDQPFNTTESAKFQDLLQYVHSCQTTLKIPGFKSVQHHIMKLREDTVASLKGMIAVRLHHSFLFLFHADFPTGTQGQGLNISGCMDITEPDCLPHDHNALRHKWLETWSALFQLLSVCCAHYHLEEVLIDFKEITREHSGANMASAVWETMELYGLKSKVQCSASISWIRTDHLHLLRSWLLLWTMLPIMTQCFMTSWPSVKQKTYLSMLLSLSQDDGSWLDSTWVTCCSWCRARNCLLTSARLQFASLQCSCSLVQTTARCVFLSQWGDRYSG